MINLKEVQRQTYAEDIAGLNVHNQLKDRSVPELKEISMSDRFPFAVMALSLTGDGNIGGIVRSSVLHGAEKVWVFGRRKFDRRSTVGSLNYIDHEIVYGFKDKDNAVFDLDKFEKIIVENNYFPIFIEQHPIAISLQDFSWFKKEQNKKFLIVMGNETNGIPIEFIDRFCGRFQGKVVSVPQRGVIRSFNVANAMNIVAWDLRVKKDWF
jgi:tRNA G18 (ribose-2'-O)-methylase SpoU